MYDLDNFIDRGTIHYKGEDRRSTIDQIFIFDIYLLHRKNFIYQKDLFFN